MHGVLVKAGEITTYHWRGRSCHTSVLRKSIQRGWLLISPELHSGEILFVATDVILYKERSYWSDVRSYGFIVYPCRDTCLPLFVLHSFGDLSKAYIGS